MARSALRSVGDAIDATRSFLLPPSLRRIASLALVVAFLGTPGTPLPTTPQVLDPTLWSGPWGDGQPDPGSGQDDGTGAAGDDPADAIDADLTGVGSGELFDPTAWPEWLFVVGAVGLALVVAYLVVGVLMRFVLVEALGHDRVAIRADGRRHLRQASAVAVVRLALGATTFAVVAGAAIVLDPGGGGGIDAGAIVFGAIATPVLVAAWLLDRLLMQFVVPTMVATDAGVLAGARRFASALAREPIEYVLFFAVRAALGVGVGVAAAIAIAVVLAVVAIALGTVGAIVIVLAGGVGALGPAAWAVVLALVGAFLLLAVLTTVTVAVPFQVYLWIYALFVLGDTDPGLDVVPDLRTVARDGEAVVDPSTHAP